MKKQLTLAANDFERYRKPTRRERFLAEMDAVVPWAELVAVIEPHYPKATSAGGRPGFGLERMLRIHCLQLWFDLSDPALEEALYDSLAMRSFVGIDLGREPVPDETTVMRFRHLLEKHDLGVRIFEEVGRVLLARGLKVSKGTIVDATIIAAPSSTKNSQSERDPEMHQTKKGQQWHFGMKAHVGVDSQSKVIHSVVVTPANTADCKVMGQLLLGHETRVYGDQAYKSQGEVIRAKAPRAKDFTNRQCKWKHFIDEAIKAKNRTKSRIRSRIEHSIGVIKGVFGFKKVRYRGLAKNGNRVFLTAALANIFLVRYTVLGAVRPQ
ncbi:MAG: IS5 family transposase [Burkholderiales bacterium]|nr:IS5 family transposase [Burkholderiales bacterium]OJX06985.1 MAG: IS5 family transposase [Burkholderiales bacterium 70-64]